MSKRIAIGLVAIVILAAAWIGSRGLSGRVIGFGGDDDCELATDRSADGVLEADAHCKWSIPAAQVHALLSAWGDQDRYFRNVAESTVLEQDDTRVLLHQIHRASGIADREVIAEGFIEVIPGGRRYRWRKAADQSKSSGRNVEVAVHEGYWDVTDGDGVTKVDYHLRYLPGGSVPSFLVSMFLSSGMEAVLNDLRQAARQPTQAVASGAGPGA